MAKFLAVIIIWVVAWFYVGYQSGVGKANYEVIKILQEAEL